MIYKLKLERFYHYNVLGLLLELILGDIHSILNFIEISQGRSNTDRGFKRGVYCRDTTVLYLAFIIRNLIRN
jgi:hypothetical protein